VGKAALAGLNGIKKVTRGFADGHEINTVYYDATAIGLDQIVEALKSAGTYIGTAED